MKLSRIERLVTAIIASQMFGQWLNANLNLDLNIFHSYFWFSFLFLSTPESSSIDYKFIPEISSYSFFVQNFPSIHPTQSPVFSNSEYCENVHAGWSHANGGCEGVDNCDVIGQFGLKASEACCVSSFDKHSKFFFSWELPGWRKDADYRWVSIIL